MESSEIASLLLPYVELTPGQLKSVSTYIDLLIRWNAKMNLTAIRGRREIIERHFGESFFAARQLCPTEFRGTVIDVGSGAGFPGLPLAIYAEGAQVTLIESNAKKAAFLNEVIFALGLKNVKLFRQRAETYPGAAELVVLRAVEKFELILDTAISLVASGGWLGLMIGASQVETALGKRELEWQAPMTIPGGHSRVLLAGIKRAIVD